MTQRLKKLFQSAAAHAEQSQRHSDGVLVTTDRRGRCLCGRLVPEHFDPDTNAFISCEALRRFRGEAA